MRIVIVGPGAMGCLFAGLLTESGQTDVWLLDKTKARSDKINENGITIEGIGGKRILKIKATSLPNEIEYADLILICVKSYDTFDAVRSIAQIVKDDSIILTLQNGLTNIDVISNAINRGKIIAGVTSYGATMLGVGHIKHAGSGDTVIGKISPNLSDQEVNQIANIFKSARISISITDNIKSFIWGKLIINASINPITAITKLKNGELLKYKETRELLKMVAEESVKIAIASGIILPYNNPVIAVESVCEMTAENVSSMLQDVLNHKRTEIDAINGAIIEKGRELNIDTSINKVLTYLVKAIELSS
ncbi:MAG: ketopantoate reductase family protein [Candidatus Poribacteria bacterium]